MTFRNFVRRVAVGIKNLKPVLQGVRQGIGITRRITEAVSPILAAELPGSRLARYATQATQAARQADTLATQAEPYASRAGAAITRAFERYARPIGPGQDR